MSKKVPSNLLEPNSALGSYLDDMLHQATEVALLKSVDEIDEALLPESLLLETKAPDENKLSIAVEPGPKRNLEQTDEIAPISQADSVPENPEGQQIELSADLFPLQFLMFKAGDNLLSMPLVKMSNVINWPDSLTRLPGEPDWVHGVLQFRGHNVRVVDSLGVLQVRNQNSTRPNYILILEGENWGITCDAIENVVTLEYDDIQWHQNIANKMTLGTIRDSLASLLSPRGIVECLQSGR